MWEELLFNLVFGEFKRMFFEFYLLFKKLKKKVNNVIHSELSSIVFGINFRPVFLDL